MEKPTIYRSLLNLIKDIKKNSTGNILNGEWLSLSLKAGVRPGGWLSPLLFTTVLELLTLIRHGKKIKGIYIEKEDLKFHRLQTSTVTENSII